MIILAQKYGQLGNRLSYLRIYIAFALEYNVTILDLSFDEYSKYFTGSSNKVVRINKIVSRLLRNLTQNLICCGLINENSNLTPTLRPDNNRHIRLIDRAIANKCIEKNVIIYDGWPIIDWQVVKKHDREIRKIFSIVKIKDVKVKAFVAAARKSGETLVGIHIRQGDYKNWDNGKHYFQSIDYVSMMIKILEMHKGIVIKFVVSCNEPQDWRLFSGFNYVKAPGNAIEDMYILAECDEIYGPQSSFSGWASFFGNVPLCWIENPRSFCKAVDSME